MMIESPPSPHSQRKPSVTFSLPDTPGAEEEDYDDQKSLLSPLRSPTIDICARAVPNTVLVAMLDRPEEMRQLVQHNRAFFAALRSHLHTAWPRFENTLYCSRATMPDRDWLDRISKALRDVPPLLQQFCDLVGYTDVEPNQQDKPYYFEHVDITRIRNHPDRLNSKAYPQFYVNCRECMNADSFEKFQHTLKIPRHEMPDDIWEMTIYDQVDKWPNLIAQLKEIIAYETEQE